MSARARSSTAGIPTAAKLDVLDPLFLLAFLFADGAVPACRESADAQNDGRIDLADPLSLLRFLFLHGQPPAPPGL